MSQDDSMLTNCPSLLHSRSPGPFLRESLKCLHKTVRQDTQAFFTTVDHVFRANPCSSSRAPVRAHCKIFVYCLPAHRRVRPDRSRAPPQLTQICGHWRAVALATPELWSSLLLKFQPNGYAGIPTMFNSEAEPLPDNTCDLFNLWLTRAAGYPLSITVIGRDELAGISENVFRSMAVHSARWGRIELDVTKADFLAFNDIPGPFPLLRSLAIRLTDVDEDSDSSVPNAIRCAPDLKAL
ncbi:hypothetical protein C8R44DRAFT_932586 [Mycena epipterygia]|nr:hypothetical protein C8R44DRAFT_932586 [Mycena epipterygia]